jgi:DNA polymerase I-like protein with 3'-5' exonuclease and polymerase domains
MKQLNLGICYGMSVRSLARGLDCHPIIAGGILWKHQRIYRRAWRYREDRVEAAMLDRHMKSKYGWPLWITHSPNERTLFNFPMQANGAEMLRLATVELCGVGDGDLVPVMLIHDGILFEVSHRDQTELIIEIMKKAGRTVCDGFEVGVDIDQELVGGARYRDKRPVAQQMWTTIMNTLVAIGTLSRSA